MVDVLASGIEYGLDGLIQSCIEFIIKNLSVETASEAIQAAVTYNLDELRATCMAFIESHPAVRAAAPAAAPTSAGLHQQEHCVHLRGDARLHPAERQAAGARRRRPCATHPRS